MPDADPVEAYKRQGVVAGASLWLFIIAGLTAANLVMQLTGSSYRWVIGLYSTRYVLRLFAMIGLSPGALAKGLLLAISLVGAIVFVYLGVLVRRKNFLALRVAALLYSTDLVVGFLVTGLRDWVGFAFHFFFLVGLIAATRAERPGGLSARRLSWDMEVFRRR